MEKLKDTIAIIIFLILVSLMILWLYATTCSEAMAKSPKAKFYDFRDQIIDGEIRRPTTLYTNARERVKFEQLLKLKKSFMYDLLDTGKERVFR